MSIDEHRRIDKKLIIISLIVIFSISIILTAVFSNKAKSPHNEQIIVKIPQPTNISSRVLFSGNTYWGRYVNEWSMASALKYEYPFSRLNEFDRENYEAWISGLECPLVSGLNLTSAQEEANLSFNCSPEYLPEAAKWFTAFTLANNHTDNQGVDGFEETRLQLDNNSIQYFGHYDPYIIDDICEVISLPVITNMDDDSQTSGFLPVAMCAYNSVFKLPKSDSIEVTKNYSPYMPVIAMPHMGLEYKALPDQLKINFYHDLIDAGVDVVLGDHPHWIQNSESYNGHLIIYSMGNFIFDQQGNTEVTRSAAIELVLSALDNDAENMSRWLEIGEQCKSFKDDCLSVIKSENLTKLSLNYEFAIVGTDSSNKITKPATPQSQELILDRLDWENTIKNLQYPYSGI